MRSTGTSILCALLLTLAGATSASADCVSGTLGASSQFCHSIIEVPAGGFACASFTSSATAKFTVFDGVNAANLTRVLKFVGTSDAQSFSTGPDILVFEDCLTNTSSTSSISFTLCLTDISANPLMCP